MHLLYKYYKGLLHICIYLSCSLRNATNEACFHMSADYIFTHNILSWGSIFLPPLACGFTLPQGDSRWRFPMTLTSFRAFPAKHPLFIALRTNVSDVSRKAFHRHSFTLCHPYCFFRFRTTQLVVSNYCLALGIKSI